MQTGWSLSSNETTALTGHAKMSDNDKVYPVLLFEEESVIKYFILF